MIGTLMASGLSLDATLALPAIEQPALVLHLEGDRVIPAAFGRMLSSRLRRARYVELAGDDHFSWVSPSIDQQLDLIFEFTGVVGTGSRVSAVWEPWSVLTPSESLAACCSTRDPRPLESILTESTRDALTSSRSPLRTRRERATRTCASLTGRAELARDGVGARVDRDVALLVAGEGALLTTCVRPMHGADEPQACLPRARLP